MSSSILQLAWLLNESELILSSCYPTTNKQSLLGLFEKAVLISKYF